MSIPLQSEQDHAFDEDVCSYCEVIYRVAEGHVCSRRQAWRTHQRSNATSHTRPTDERGRMMFGPSQAVLEEHSPERVTKRHQLAKALMLEDLPKGEE